MPGDIYDVIHDMFCVIAWSHFVGCNTLMTHLAQLLVSWGVFIMVIHGNFQWFRITMYPPKYAYSSHSVVFCCDLLVVGFTHVIKGYFTGTWAITIVPQPGKQSQRNNNFPTLYGLLNFVLHSDYPRARSDVIVLQATICQLLNFDLAQLLIDLTLSQGTLLLILLYPRCIINRNMIILHQNDVYITVTSHEH